MEPGFSQWATDQMVLLSQYEPPIFRTDGGIVFEIRVYSNKNGLDFRLIFSGNASFSVDYGAQNHERSILLVYVRVSNKPCYIVRDGLASERFGGRRYLLPSTDNVSLFRRRNTRPASDYRGGHWACRSDGARKTNAQQVGAIRPSWRRKPQQLLLYTAAISRYCYKQAGTVACRRTRRRRGASTRFTHQLVRPRPSPARRSKVSDKRRAVPTHYAAATASETGFLGNPRRRPTPPADRHETVVNTETGTQAYLRRRAGSVHDEM